MGNCIEYEPTIITSGGHHLTRSQLEAMNAREKNKPVCTAIKAAPNMFPAIQDPCTETQTTEYATPALSPVVTPRKSEFRQLIHTRWRIGEYQIPDDCDGFLMGTTAILYLRKSDDPKEQQIQQLNYNNFINTMAEMIMKYAPQIQKLREGLK